MGLSYRIRILLTVKIIIIMVKQVLPIGSMIKTIILGMMMEKDIQNGVQVMGHPLDY